jgi:hypothetical protein
LKHWRIFINKKLISLQNNINYSNVEYTYVFNEYPFQQPSNNNSTDKLFSNGIHPITRLITDLAAFTVRVDSIINNNTAGLMGGLFLFSSTIVHPTHERFLPQGSLKDFVNDNKLKLKQSSFLLGIIANTILGITAMSTFTGNNSCSKWNHTVRSIFRLGNTFSLLGTYLNENTHKKAILYLGVAGGASGTIASSL